MALNPTIQSFLQSLNVAMMSDDPMVLRSVLDGLNDGLRLDVPPVNHFVVPAYNLAHEMGTQMGKNLKEKLKEKGETADAALIEKAREKYAMGSDDNVEIDDDAEVSHGDNGAFVAAWVYVKHEGWKCGNCGVVIPKSSEDGPCEQCGKDDWHDLDD